MNKDELIVLAEQMSIDEYVYDEERGYSTSEGSPSDLAYEIARSLSGCSNASCFNGPA